MTTPYPGFPPNYSNLNVIDGLARQCIVIDIRSRGNLSQVQLTMIREQLEASLQKFIAKLPELESIQVVEQNQFDRLLLDGLRLNRA